MYFFKKNSAARIGFEGRTERRRARVRGGRPAGRNAVPEKPMRAAEFFYKLVSSQVADAARCLADGLVDPNGGEPERDEG
jgi:hypothetical protein